MASFSPKHQPFGCGHAHKSPYNIPALHSSEKKRHDRHSSALTETISELMTGDVQLERGMYTQKPVAILVSVREENV